MKVGTTFAPCLTVYLTKSFSHKCFLTGLDPKSEEKISVSVVIAKYLLCLFPLPPTPSEL